MLRSTARYIRQKAEYIARTDGANLPDHFVATVIEERDTVTLRLPNGSIAQHVPKTSFVGVLGGTSQPGDRVVVSKIGGAFDPSFGRSRSAVTQNITVIATIDSRMPMFMGVTNMLGINPSNVSGSLGLAADSPILNPKYAGLKPPIQQGNINIPATGTRTRTTHLAVHHIAGDNSTVEGIDAYHKSRGWAGIGYHAFINRQGVIYQGRQFDQIGSNVGQHNSYIVGISLDGNLSKTQPTAAQLQSLVGILTWLCLSYNIAPDKIWGHRDFKGHESNNCPGDNLYRRLPEIRQMVSDNIRRNIGH